MAAAQPGPPRGLALPPWSRRGGRAAACPRPRCSRRAAEPPAAIGPAVLPHDLADLAAAAAGHRRDDGSRAVAASRRPLTRNRTLATWHLVSKTPEVGTRQRSRCGSPGGGSQPGSAGRRPLAPHALPGSEGSRAQGGVRPDPDPHGATSLLVAATMVPLASSRWFLMSRTGRPPRYHHCRILQPLGPLR